MMPAFSRILVPTDFSADSNTALVAAASLARRLGASIHLLHVVLDAVGAVNRRERIEAEARTRLGVLAGTISDVPVCWDVLIGQPADVIARMASDMRADLIIMGTHGRCVVGNVMGSVAARVIRRAHCPVMTVRESGAVRLSAPPPVGAVEDQSVAQAP